MHNTVPCRLNALLTNRWLLAVLIAVPMISAALTAKMSFDEAIWAYIGGGWFGEGAKPYVERFDNKPPGVLLVFGFSDLASGASVWPARLAGVLAMVSTGLVLYAIGRRLLGRTAGALAMIFLGTMLPREVFDGPYAAHTESFMILFSTLAFYFLLRAFSAGGTARYLRELFLAWLSVGVATFCFKQIALCTAAGLLAFHWLHRKSAGAKVHWPRDLAVAAGALGASVILALAPLAVSGVQAGEYGRAVWVSLFQAGAANTSLSDRLAECLRAWRCGEFLLFALLLAVFLAQWKRLRSAAVPMAGIAAWLIADFVGANASGNYYGHQLKQVLPPLALASSLGLCALLRTTDATADRARGRSPAAVALAVLLLMPYGTLLTCLSVRPQQNPDRELGTWIRNHSTPADSVFPCGPRSMQILAWSGRRTPFRYFNLMFLSLPGAEAEMDAGLAHSPPRYLILPVGGIKELSPRERAVADRLARMIESSYAPRLTAWDYCVYERTPGPSCSPF